MLGRGLLLAALWPGACAGVPVIEEEPRAPGRWDLCAAAGAAEAMQAAIAASGSLRWAEALAASKRVVDLCPECVRAHWLRVDAARQLGGETWRSLRAELQAVPDDGKSPLPPFLHGLAEDEPAMLDDRLAVCLQRDSGFWFAHEARGRIHLKLQRPEQALKHFRAALSLDGGDADARRDAARAMVQLGHHEQAEAELKRYLRVRPGDRQVRKEHARLLIYRLGRGSEVAESLEAMLREDAGDVEVLMDRAAIAWFDRQFDYAIELYHRVLQADPSQARAVLNLGNLHYDVLARAGGEARVAALHRARAAYRYFLRMPYSGDLYDVWDQHLGVPQRLRQIEAEIGPPGENWRPTLQDF
jgi:tetratricopeptide (TPR) repeat protein